jgi:pyrimidine deaminase RibD-like protein
MYAHELYEAGKPQVVVTYPGRFQPFHQGHAGVFAKLQKQFGRDSVYILTSNDQSSAKSPFNFSDKYQLMTAAGVPGDRIIETNQMYKLPAGFDPSSTIFVTAVGAPDKDRLNPDTFTKRDQKDKDGNVIKPAGSASYYKTWDESHAPMTADQHGYVIVIPEIKKAVNIKGKTYDVSHGTECRNLWNMVRNDPESSKEFLAGLYGRATSELVHIFNKIPAAVSEDIGQVDSNYSSSPISGARVFHEIADIEETDEKHYHDWKEFDQDRTAQILEFLREMQPGIFEKFGNEYVENLAQKVFQAGPQRSLTQLAGDVIRALKQEMSEDAAGVGVVAKNKKMAKDPRYSMSITKDVKPRTPKNMLRDFRLAEDFSARINPEDFEIKNFDKLDHILVNLCEMVVEGQKLNADAFGMVAACVLDPDNNFAFGINYFDDGKDKRIHAERAAIMNYEAEHGRVPAGSIILTTLSPCCHPMDDRYGDSCTEIINDTDCHKVYCGYKDPTQEEDMNKTFHVMQTRNPAIVKMCKTFARTFLGNVVKEEAKNNRSVTEEDMMAMIKEFMPLAMKELKLKEIPHIVLQPHIKSNDGQATFGRFVNEEEKIYLGIADRHPVDILRTLAHEMVHFKQYEQGKMYDGAGDTGSPIENEAHWVAGIIMRHFNKKYPNAIKSKPLELDESWSKEYKSSINCSDPKGFSQKAHCAGRKKNEDRHPNDTPYGPEFKPTMPQGSVRVDVSDVYDWYKLGQHISNLKGLGKHDFGKGPPSTMFSFGSEEEEHKYIKDLEKTGLTTTDIDPVDPNQPKNMPRQKVDPTFNVAENFADGRNPQDKGDSARHGIPKKASLSTLDKITRSKTASPRKKQLAHWQANMRRGREK